MQRLVDKISILDGGMQLLFFVILLEESVPKEMSRTFRRMIAIIVIIGATAIITVLFILVLGLLIGMWTF